MKIRMLALVLCGASAAIAAGLDFDRTVKAVEFHYSVKKTHIPLMGLANLVVKVAHPAGAKDFKLAVFENLNAEGDPSGVDRIVHELAGRGMRPMVRQQSRRAGESTLIYAQQHGMDTRMLIVTFGHNEGTVIQVTVDPETLMKTIKEPGGARRMFYGGDR